MGTKFYTARNIKSSNSGLSVVHHFILSLFLILTGFSSFSQTSLSFTQIPAGNADLIAPGRGTEQWIGRTWDNGVGGGIEVPAGNTKGLNAYYRFLWASDIETAQGVYNWTKFDAQINAAIDNGQMFSFGLMPMCTACGLGAVSYPAYLHTLMQSEASGSQDWQNSDGNWVPNWNSPNYLGRYQALLNAVAAHIAGGTHSGKNYKDVIYYVDIRGYGDFGEWHTYPWYGTEPAGRKATSATLKSFIDMNLAAFPNYPNIILAGAYDGGDASITPADVTYYALTATNAWGQIGWRRDNWGDPGTSVMLDGNGGSYNSTAFAPVIMSKYKFAPVVGEPNNSTATYSCGAMYCDLTNEIKLYHATSFGNGNFPNTFDAATQSNVISASKASGYRLMLTGGSMTTTLASGGAFNITLNWQNIGVSPVYENWNVVYELRNSSGTVVWSGNSAFKPKLFLPQSTATPTSDNLNLTTVTPGTYSMYLIIRDPLNYKKPLPLAITGVNSDGSYLLRSNITVGTGTGNQSPTASAGANQTVQLPTSTASLAGTGTDPDGTIASYTWSKVSGPAGATITTPNASNTTITGLVQGVYVYSMLVKDNLGATATATVQVTVNAASTGGPFTVNAGPDQTLTAGLTTASLSGSIPASTPASGSDTLNLIVIQGESNAAGNADNSAAPASELASRSSVQILNHVTGKFENLHVGVNNEQDTYFDNTHHGLELGLANEVEAGRLANPTYLVKIGISGSYVEEWLPNNSTPYQLWNGWIGYVDAAVAQMKTLGKPFRIIFWQSLGLNDRYGQGTASATFVSKMATIRANFRARYGANIPFLSTNFNNPPAQTFDWSNLWTQMAASDPLFFSIPVTGATYVDAGVHFDYAGFKLIAHNMVNTMLTLGEGPASGTGTGTTYTPTWSKVSGPAGVTISTPAAANTGLTGLTAGTYVFRLTVKDNNGVSVSDDVQITVNAATNKSPVANAGIDQSITLPTNSVTINGSASNDADGSIASYLWTKISGPAQFTITNGSAVTTTVTNLSAGLYYFQLKVTDNLGATALDTVKISVGAAPVNLPPISNAGADKTITLPTNSVTLNGSASSDPDGSIASYLWTKISGPAQYTLGNNATASTLLSNLTAGLYSFQLKVTDNGGAIALDTIKINVNAAPANQLPVANAGADITITLPTNIANLNGSGSSDPDGTIASYSWTQVSGPATATISTSTAVSTGLAGLLQGVYVFSLKVTDNSGAVNLDSVKVTVNAAANQPPVANAGSSKTITLPVNSTSLDGSLSSDADGSISSYAWTQVSGPATSTITGAGTSVATATGMVAGLYTFQLIVTDNKGATASATVKVTVAAAAPQPPVANAGGNQTITLPVNSATINGSSSSASSGSIVSYAWTEKSGPSTVGLSNTAINTLNNLQAGVYVFTLTVTDNNGATGTDQVIITVNAAANQPPVANAGSSKTITLPVNSTSLDGSLSSDADGSISSYAWTQVSGPATSTITGAGTSVATATGMVAGLYTFQLIVTDNKGATASATVKVTVAAAAPQPPVANAGGNQTITLPVNSATINGSSSSASSGSIVSYAWTEKSGPSTVGLSNTAINTLNNLQAGVYVFTLTVTDNNGATGTDQVTITVNAAANQPPVANAGSSKTITLPVNSTSLDGSLSSDADGSISSYAWTQVSGPATSTITGAGTSVATATGMVAGLYTFQLIVTDNKGATASATVKVTVAAAAPQPPVANAGANQTITLPVNSATINGSSSSASSGSIVSYAWTEKSGPSTVGLSNTAINTLNNLQAGVYVFTLTVTDNNGATGTDQVTITVNAAANQPPVANAGSSINLTLPVNSTNLDGTQSTDPNGTISSYSWVRISGPNTPGISGANTSTPNVSGLIAGQYVYQLTVTDNNGASSSAQVKIIVSPAANVIPVANAGSNQSITAPANTVTLNGSASNDPDGTITAYSWVTISGPGSITISNSNTATPTATGLTTGVYIFELTVTDNSGATAQDEVTVVVNPKPVLPNQAPVANAGTNETITLPDNSTSLIGTSSFDPDGTIKNYAWTQISGPNSSVITAGNTATATASQLIVGQYVYQLTVTDNNGATNTDQVTITVNPGVSKVNTPPVADAGNNDTISLPVNNYTLNAGASTDPDGTIDAYEWKQVSGPNTASSSSMSSAQVSISNLQAGEYEFEVTVTDNAGASSVATMHLTVEPGSTVNDKLVLFPNPAHHMITGKVTSAVTGTVKIYVYDMNGKLVAVTEAEKYNDVLYKSFDISNLAPGMYSAQIIIANRKTMVTKFIKY